MLDDEKYQREAFQALLLQQDHKALEIGEQMSRIQNELASLTSVELKKKDLKVIFLWMLFITFGKMFWQLDNTSDLALAPSPAPIVPSEDAIAVLDLHLCTILRVFTSNIGLESYE